MLISEKTMFITSRFAPSPTGYLHLGHAFSALQVSKRAELVHLRLEDIDAGRCRPEFAAGVLEDLEWLGLRWHADIRVQSQHFTDYQRALDRLVAMELLYPCFCTRAEIARALSAPHGGEKRYPGTCRTLDHSLRADRIASGAPFSLRLRMEPAIKMVPALRFFEETKGWVTAKPAPFGDVVLARRDVPASYHLCVVHDDALQDITHVIRGEDLFGATHIHVLLQRLLGLPTPIYHHHKLLSDQTGRRLAKRDGAQTLRALRAQGIDPKAIFGHLAGDLG